MTNKKIGLYIDCSHGISGDMSVGALLGLGVNQNTFHHKIDNLNIPGFSIAITEIEKHGKKVWDYDVMIENDVTQPPLKRNILDIRKIINQSTLNLTEKDIAKNIFEIAASAGAKAHQVALEDFYFHESGAVDSLADIIGIAICLNAVIQNNKISHIFISELTDGYGPITLKNGRTLPIPVPAVHKIVEVFNLPYKNSDVFGELITPTGASFAASVFSKMTETLPHQYHVLKSSFGNGKRKNDSKSMLRMDIIEWEA